MEKAIAENLINSLDSHSYFRLPDKEKDKLLGSLTAIDLLLGEEIYELDSEVVLNWEEADRSEILSLDWMLNNNTFKRKSTKEKLLRSIDRGLMDLMINCRNPYSLIAKITEFEFRCKKKDKFKWYSMDKPLLIIPGVENERIDEWEQKNTIYRKEMFRYFAKKISKGEYYAGFK